MLAASLLNGLAKVYVLAALSTCPVMQAPQVDVKLVTQEINYRQDLTSADLHSQMAENKNSTYALDSRQKIEGATDSEITGAYAVTYRDMTDKKGDTCLYVDTVHLTFAYKPTVYIAADFLGAKCYANVVKEHEEQHVALDKKSIKEYFPLIRKDVQKYLQSLGYQGQGPYKATDVFTQKEALTQAIISVSESMLERLKEDRRLRQAVLDTAESAPQELSHCAQDMSKWQKVH